MKSSNTSIWIICVPSNLYSIDIQEIWDGWMNGWTDGGTLSKRMEKLNATQLFKLSTALELKTAMI